LFHDISHSPFLFIFFFLEKKPNSQRERAQLVRAFDDADENTAGATKFYTTSAGPKDGLFLRRVRRRDLLVLLT
jgi:hypothetical protein